MVNAVVQYSLEEIPLADTSAYSNVPSNVTLDTNAHI